MGRPPSKRKRSEELQEEAVKMYMDGKPQDEIAFWLGVSQGYVSQLIKRSKSITDEQREARKNKSRRHEQHAKIPLEDYPLIHRLLDEGESQARVAKIFGVNPSRISRIRKSGRGRTRRYKRQS